METTTAAAIYRPSPKQAEAFLWSKDGTKCVPRKGAFHIDFAYVDALTAEWEATIRVYREEASWEDIF